MRSHVGCHTYRDTRTAINEQVRETARQYSRLTQTIVEVRHHINGIFLDVAKHLFCQLRQACLGITHSRCAITIDVTKVTLAIYQAITHVPRLSQTHQSAVDTAVTVRVVFTHNVSDDTCRFLCRFVATYTQFVHSEQHAALYGFKTVTHIRQRTADDYTHRIVDVRLTHFLVNLDGNNLVMFGHIQAFHVQAFRILTF